MGSTIGHVLKQLRTDLESGTKYDTFYIHDKAAGAGFEYGYPISFDLENWIDVYDEETGVDCAAYPLDYLTIENLKVGRISPIARQAWGNSANLKQYDAMLLVGLPYETFTKTGSQLDISLVMIPIEYCDEDISHITQRKNCVAKLRDSPTDRHINKIDGMSGGPIFGVNNINGQIKYWVIGIQSSWIESRRIVLFNPIIGFFELLEEAITRSKS